MPHLVFSEFVSIDCSTFWSLIFSISNKIYARAVSVIFCSMSRSYSIRTRVNGKYIKNTATFVNVCLNYLVLCIFNFFRLIPRIFSLSISQNLTKTMRAPFHCFVVVCDVQFLFNSIGRKYKIYKNFYNIL